MHARYTSHPAFLVALGMTVLTVAFLWQGLGLVTGGHGGHGHGGEVELTREQFAQRTEEFITAFQQEDGTVKPYASEASLHEDPSHGDSHADHSDHGADAVDVYIMAYQWDFRPGDLRLEADVAYRFRMMAMDVDHGLAIQYPGGSTVVRLPHGMLVDHTFTFSEPGEYLIYCTYYCGELHEAMRAKIIVEA